MTKTEFIKKFPPLENSVIVDDFLDFYNKGYEEGYNEGYKETVEEFRETVNECGEENNELKSQNNELKETISKLKEEIKILYNVLNLTSDITLKYKKENEELRDEITVNIKVEKETKE